MWRTRHTQIRIAAYFNRSFPSKGSLSVFIQLILLDVWVFFYSFFFYSFFKYKIHMFNFLLGIIWNFSRNESIDGQFFSHVERLIFYQAFIKQIFFIFEYYTKLTNRAFGLFKELFVAFIFCLFFFFLKLYKLCVKNRCFRLKSIRYVEDLRIFAMGKSKTHIFQ